MEVAPVKVQLVADMALNVKHNNNQCNIIQFRPNGAKFYYINHGDFDIVRTNVAVFVFGHLLLIWAMFLYLQDHKWQTEVWGK